MRKVVVAVLLMGQLMSMRVLTQAQDGNNGLPYQTLAEFQTALNAAVSSGDIEPFWNDITALEQMPLIFDDTAVFLYRGDARSVEWRGDFNSWGSSAEFHGTQQGDTDLWTMTHQFPLDARLDYKIVLDSNTWILDPLNPRQQWGGFGPNSEFSMPAYVYSPYVVPRDDIEHGSLSDNLTIFSDLLNYQLHYRVYTPAGYDDLDTLPVIYVTDGQEYADEKLGSMLAVLDNLIADGAISPVIAVFIDPRNPDNSSQNRREDEYITNDDFIGFLATELVPTIDAVYDTDDSPDGQAILGTSLGGLNAAYVGLNYPAVFHLIAIQSPALWVATEVIDSYATGEMLPLKIFMSTGTISDDTENTRHLREVLQSKGYPLHYIEVSEGHSWGNWRALLDDLLIYFFGPDRP